MSRKNILLISQIGMLTALCLMFQFLRYVIPSLPIPIPGIGNGQTLIIGSLVNLVLFVAVATTGLWGGVIISLVSPLMAFFQGHLLFPQMILVVALGNLALVILFYLFTNKNNMFKNLGRISISDNPAEQETKKFEVFDIIGVIVSSAVKFGIMWAAVAWVIVPFLPQIKSGAPARSINTLKITLLAGFSWPQLITALIGGAIAIAIIPIIKKAIKSINS